ncbi:MAG: DNA-binding protein [Elusimicrobia bacterium]|nr:DNA-binding protein [Elusimicrobiota bacterium]
MAREFMFSLPRRSDIHAQVEAFCREKKVRKGWINVLGATEEVALGYYDQVRHVYERKVFKEEMEIVSCVGNVSIKDGKPFLHLHAAMGDTKLRLWGGHLFPGSKVFAAEVSLREVSGPALVRRPDPSTGLTLWPCKLR